jgi:hypothetical protein
MHRKISSDIGQSCFNQLCWFLFSQLADVDGVFFFFLHLSNICHICAVSIQALSHPQFDRHSVGSTTVYSGFDYSVRSSFLTGSSRFCSKLFLCVIRILPCFPSLFKVQLPEHRKLLDKFLYFF